MGHAAQHQAAAAAPYEDRFISHVEIAERLSLNSDHVRDRLTKRKDFPRAFQFGGVRRWKAEEVEDWIESQRKAPDGRRTRGQ
ncbi:helix-turn-helix transcriptional regulator [Achromobacter mucicolens]|uniref:helix-turn-helix transcriptional regulator n=1 Tax=Achromobacter mucicolens TaxID=1389922 RepID=UPI001CBAD26E|nr:helix-turn-helix domain-containing protein [Achromobacter mucicolens]UAN04423.1 hypothetical protein K9D24_09915 [Achromobacter mucicolens]